MMKKNMLLMIRNAHLPRAIAKPGLVAMCLCALGCDSGADRANMSYKISPPGHPAMRVDKVGSVATATALPHGHPPVGDSGGRKQASTTQTTQTTQTPQTPEAATKRLLGQLSAFGLRATLPTGWRVLPSKSVMRWGTVGLDRVEGDKEDGEMSIMPAGGALDANVDRWRGQFKENPEARRTPVPLGPGIDATLIEIEGTFNSGGGPMAKSGGPKADTLLVGAIIKVTGQDMLLFLKAWGPRRTMEKWRGSIKEFVSTLQPAK